MIIISRIGTSRNIQPNSQCNSMAATKTTTALLVIMSIMLNMMAVATNARTNAKVIMIRRQSSLKAIFSNHDKITIPSSNKPTLQTSLCPSNTNHHAMNDTFCYLFPPTPLPELRNLAFLSPDRKEISRNVALSSRPQRLSFPCAPLAMPYSKVLTYFRTEFFRSLTRNRFIPMSSQYSSPPSSCLYSSSSSGVTSDISSSKRWSSLFDSFRKYVTFSDHTAHVIVPRLPENTTFTCEDIVQWVTFMAYSRNRSERMTQKPSGYLAGGDEIDANNIPMCDYNHLEMMKNISSILKQFNLDQNKNIAKECNIGNSGSSQTIFGFDQDEYQHRRNAIIQSEWMEGESASRTGLAPILIHDENQQSANAPNEYDDYYEPLDPSYRHDPSLFPQPLSFLSHSRTGEISSTRNLIASELLAIGAVWYLPYSSTTSIMDRFDPSSGIKPRRCNVGYWNTTVQFGDYFRVHFDPRRFAVTNLHDWGISFTADDALNSLNSFEAETVKVISDDNSNSNLAPRTKPGVIVARNDDAGYLIINKPPNVPVHSTVDNVLENVASSVGRMLWKERKESLLSSALLKTDNPEHVTLSEGQKQSESENRNREHFINHPHQRKKKTRKQKKRALIYVATPQRLDQNTTGLLVVATKKSFASYFAKLLRTKTDGQLLTATNTPASNNTNTSAPLDVTTSGNGSAASPPPSASCGVHKSYRCLVCIIPDTNIASSSTPTDTGSFITTSRRPITSLASAVKRLQTYASKGVILRHYLEPSIRAPKRFVSAIPPNKMDGKEELSWAECLLRITNVGDVCTVMGNLPSENLAKSLWGDYGKPDGCIAVVELEVELLTGRTHQIRGQLCAEGFPLVGDAQYGGALPNSSSLWKEKYQVRGNRGNSKINYDVVDDNETKKMECYLDSERLALQCCALKFVDPDGIDVTADDRTTVLRRSNRWNSFRLNRTFWSPFVNKYLKETAEISLQDTTSFLKEEATILKQSDKTCPSRVLATQPKTAQVKLPPKVLLSPGPNKYIVVRARNDNASASSSPLLTQNNDSEELWFVRSASPAECGGPYHANVAEKILRQLDALGFSDVQVMGGGRIDYFRNDDVRHAHVFGFSYGFGKGNHEQVASIIEQYTDIIATFDNSDKLY